MTMQNKNNKLSNVQLLRHLNGSQSHFDKAYNADGAGVIEPGNVTRMAALKGNPSFIGQFNTDVKIKYYSVNAGVYTERSAAYILANAPTLATKLAAIFFAQTDFAAGYANAKAQFPLNVWNYGIPFIFGATTYPQVNGVVFDSTIAAACVAGDMIIPYYATSGGVNYVAIVILRTQEVALGTMLASLNSDMFGINNIRYTLTDTSQAGLTQYRNILYMLTQTFLGTFTKQNISVNAMKNPEQFQAGIVDVPVEKVFDKNIGFGFYVNYDAVDSISLGMFLNLIDKLAA